MENTTHFIIRSIILLALLISTSCKKFVQVPPPKTQTELSRIFADDQSAMSAATGLYYAMQAANLQFTSGGITITTAHSADELVTVIANTTYDGFRNNNILSDNATILGLWNNAYKNIYHANAVVEGLDGSQTLTSSLKDQLKGEMLYLRAWHYFLLTNLYGDVPLELTTAYEVNASMDRTPQDEIYSQIIADLQLSRELLSKSFSTSVNTRPSSAAATALLAKVYLYRQQWSRAEELATEVINTGRYSIENLSNVFLQSSKETIFQITRQSANTAEGGSFIPASATVLPTYALTAYLLDAFKLGDNRKNNWTKSNTVNGIQYYYPFKYKVRSSTTVTEATIVHRLGEVYLIRAEARAQQGKLKDAIDDVDIIRTRAGLLTQLLKNINPNISKENLLSEIASERQVEMFTEWGNRWMDLIRANQADVILGARKAPNWQSTDARYPIPYNQILLNPALTQNPGYNF